MVCDLNMANQKKKKKNTHLHNRYHHRYNGRVVEESRKDRQRQGQAHLCPEH